MKKQELVAKIADKSELSKADAERAINALVDVVGESLVQDENVTIPGLGQFKTKQNAERQGRNPQTGEAITIQASRGATFKVSKSLKDLVKQ